MKELLEAARIDPDDKRANRMDAEAAKKASSDDVYQVFDRNQANKLLLNGKAYISVTNAFPKILKLNQQTEAKPLEMHGLRNTTQYTSMELQLNKQGNSIYYWTFTLGTSDGRGGKSSNAYLRDSPGVFNSLNTEQDIKNENIAEKRKISTSKVNKSQREQDKKLMSRKKVKEDQSLVILLYNEKVIGTFLGSFVQLSVIGLYATIVIAVGRFIRIIFDRIGQRLIFEELPSTKNLYELCEGIYIA